MRACADLRMPAESLTHHLHMRAHSIREVYRPHSRHVVVPHAAVTSSPVILIYVRREGAAVLS